MISLCSALVVLNIQKELWFPTPCAWMNILSILCQILIYKCLYNMYSNVHLHISMFVQIFGECFVSIIFVESSSQNDDRLGGKIKRVSFSQSKKSNPLIDQRKYQHVCWSVYASTCTKFGHLSKFFIIIIEDSRLPSSHSSLLSALCSLLSALCSLLSALCSLLSPLSSLLSRLHSAFLASLKDSTLKQYSHAKSLFILPLTFISGEVNLLDYSQSVFFADYSIYCVCDKLKKKLLKPPSDVCGPMDVCKSPHTPYQTTTSWASTETQS